MPPLLDEKGQVAQPTTREAKLALLHRHCRAMRRKSRAHYRKFKTLKRRSQGIEACLMGLSTATSSAIFVAMLGRPDVVILGAVLSSVATVGGAIARVYDLPGKYHSAQTTYLQLVDLNRDMTNRLLRNNLSSDDLDVMLTELNARLGLIEDASNPVSESEGDCDQSSRPARISV